MTSRISLFRNAFSFNKIVLCSTTTLILGAGFYRYHSTQPTATVIASPNKNNEIVSYSQKHLFYDYALFANNRQMFERITIPSGEISAINAINEKKHILITIQGEGEVRYTPQNGKIISGTDTTNTNVLCKQLKLGNSVVIPSTNWHQIESKHTTQDLVLVVTSLPSKN